MLNRRLLSLLLCMAMITGLMMACDHQSPPPTEESTPSEDSTEQPTEPLEDSTEQSTEPSEDSTEQPTEPSEDSTEQSTEPSEDSTEQPTEPSEDSTEQSTEPSEDSTEQPTEPSEDPPVIEDPEVAEATTLFAVPNGWLYDLDVYITCIEMADLLEAMLYARIPEPSQVTLSWLNSPEWVDNSVCYRGHAVGYIYRLALENYHGIENAQDAYNYDPFQYIRTLSIYHDRVGSALPCMEMKLFNEGKLPQNDTVGFDAYGSIYCAAQTDMTNYLPILDVDEDLYIRYDEPITRKEAIIACKRLYNAYLDKTAVPVSSIGKLEFTPEQLAKAAEMPDASWNSLPSWSGMGINLTHLTGYMRESDFAMWQKYGIDFARIFVNDELLQWNGEEMTIPQYLLDNLDEAMQWAIEYGVHLCVLLDEDGFNGASMGVAGFYDDQLTERLISCYQMLARRYADLPNNVFSLNIFNEPWMLSLDDEELYVKKAREVISAIREYGDDRLIFVDGLAGSQQPVYGLATDRVALATHMYGPDSLYTAGWDYNAWWYAGQQWPYDYVTGFVFSAEENYTFEGNFPKGMQVQLLIGNTDDANGELLLYADGELIESLPLNADNRSIMQEFSPLTSDAKELVLEWHGDTGLGFRGIALVYPEKGESAVPKMVSPWNDGQYTHTLCENKVVLIVCEMDFAFDGEYANPVIAVADDGSYTVTHDGGKRYTYGKDYYASMLEKWVAFSKQTGVAVMVQEWGPYADAYISQEAAIGVSIAGAKAMKEAGFPWCIWVQLLNTEKWDTEPLVDGTYRINTGLLEALEPYMKD